MSFERLQWLLAGTLRRRIGVGIGLVMSAMSALFLYDVTRRQEAYVHREHHEQTVVLAQTLAKLAAAPLISRDFAALQEIVEQLTQYPGLLHAIIADSEGQILAHSDPSKTGLFLADLPVNKTELRILEKTRRQVDLIAPVMLSGQFIGWVRVGMSSQAFDEEMAEVRGSGFIHALIALVLGLVVAAATSRYLIRRLNAIERVADAVEGGASGMRVSLSGNDEISRLARRFDEMLDSLARQQEALRESETQFRTIYDTLNDAVFIHDAGDGRILDVNASACRMYGYPREALLTLDIAAISANVPPYTQETARQCICHCLEQGWHAFEWLARDATGRQFWVAVNLKLFMLAGQTRVLAVVRDIDQRKHTEDEQRALIRKLEEAQNQLLQSEKMASIGQLAAGVAHELNNPIGFVNSNLGTLKNYLEDIFEIADADARALAESGAAGPGVEAARALRAAKDFDYLRQDIFQLLGESSDGLLRVKKIVQDLKDFSRPGESSWQWADLNQGLESTLNIVWNELKYKCAVNKDYGDLPPVRCLPSQLNQVFMNLLVNAAQAIETRGEITIATRRRGDDAVQVSIADTGQGIAAEHLKRIFEPFFTTKPIGKGTGLGLSIAWSIINKHHGRIEVESSPGRGTTFTITLPVEQAAGDDAETAAATPP